MWELDYKESWALKNWCFWTVVLEKTLESPLDCKEIQPVHPKGDRSWVFIGWTNAKAETPILWTPDTKSWLIGKDPDAGKDWGQEEKGMTQDEMVGWHHRLDGHGFGWTLGVGDGQGGLACCDSWACKESDITELLNWTEQQQGCLLSAFAEIASCATAAADLQHLLREIQGGEWGTLCSRETGGMGLYSARYFQKLFHDPNPCISSYLENH